MTSPDRRSFIVKILTAGAAATTAGCSTDSTTSPSESTRTTRKPTVAGTKTRPTTTDSNSEPVTVEWLDNSLSRDARTEREALRALRRAGLDESVSVEFTSPPMVGIEDIRRVLDNRRESPTLLMSPTGVAELAPCVLAEQFDLPPIASLVPDGTAAELQSELFDVAVRCGSARGKLYGLPLAADPTVIVYRTGLLDRAGYDPTSWQSQVPTWQQFTDIVSDAKATLDRVDAGFTFPASPSSGAVGNTLLPVSFRSRGGAYFGDPSRYLFGPVGDRPVTVGSEPVERSVRMYRTFVRGGGANSQPYSEIAPDDVLEWSPPEASKQFLDRAVVASLTSGQFLLGARSQLPSDARAGIALPPYGVGDDASGYPLTGGSRPGYSGRYVIVNPHAPREKQRAAGRVLAALGTDTFRSYAYEHLNWLPPSPGIYDELPDSRFSRRDIDVLRRATERAVAPPLTPVWPEQWRLVAAAVSACLRGERTPRATVDKIERGFKRLESDS